LSLLMHMVDSGAFSDKKILLVDKDPKHANDRTWCFWKEDDGLFEPIVYKRWQKLWFYGDNYSAQLQLQRYHYKMIRGADFYRYCFDKLRAETNIDILFEEVQEVFSDSQTGVVVNGRKIYADYVFNSILFKKPSLRANEYWLLQHFMGWVIETPSDCFDEQVGTLMDFRIDQSQGTAFCYVLPFTARSALVEYTLFSPELLKQKEYEEGLHDYITKHLNLSSYEVIEKEFGVIPMTNYKFPSRQHKIINIGTAGGQTKGSSGYTFNFIQKHSKAIVASILETGKPFISPSPGRFRFYDSVLLKVLSDGMVPGVNVFTELFKKNDVHNVLRFLDNETTVAEEVKIISTLPTLPFLQAGIKHFL
jgi:lycopene beta-cyclase